MSIKSDLVAQLLLSLEDVRCAAPRLVLEELIKRDTHGGGIPEFRCTDVLTDLEVTSLTQLKSLIIENNIDIQLSISSHSSSFKDKCKPVRLVLKNVKVKFYPVNEDSFFLSGLSADENNICFQMGYVGDNDDVLPMKLLDITFVGINND